MKERLSTASIEYSMNRMPARVYLRNLKLAVFAHAVLTRSLAVQDWDWVNIKLL